MLKTPIYRYPPVFFLLALVFNAAAFPQNDGSYGTDILPDQSISWRAYDGYFVLRPCLKSMFDGGQIAKNVDCTTNSCLCDKANLDSNMAILSSEVPKTCTDIRAVDIPHATSVLGGYCAKMKTDGSPNSAAPTTATNTSPTEPTEDSTISPGAVDPIYPTTLVTQTSATAPAESTPTDGADGGGEPSPTTATGGPITLPGAATTSREDDHPVPASPAPLPPLPDTPPASNTAPQKEGSNKSGTIAGIVAGAVVAIIAALLFWMCLCGPCSKRKRGDESRYAAAARIVSFGKHPKNGQLPEMEISPYGHFAAAAAELEAPETPTFPGPHELETTSTFARPHELDTTPPRSPQVKSLNDSPPRSNLLDEKTRVDSAAVLHSPQF